MAYLIVRLDRYLRMFLFLFLFLTVGSPGSAAQVTLSNIGGSFQSDIGIDFNEKTGALITSVHFLDNAVPNSSNNLASVDPLTGVHTVFAPTFAGSNDELKVAVARSVTPALGCPIAAVPVGTVFTSRGIPSSGQPTQVVMVAHDGSGFISVALVDGAIIDHAPVRGGIYFDFECVYNAGGVNHLFVVTADPAADGSGNIGGHVWDIPVLSGTPGSLAFGPPRHIKFIAKPNSAIPAHLEGLVVVPKDTTKYGPWAGKLVTGDEDRQLTALGVFNGLNPKIYAIDPATGVCSQNNSASNSASCTGTFSISGPTPHPEDFDFIDGDFYGVAFNNHNVTGQGRILTAPAANFLVANGDILITQEYPIDQPDNSHPVDAGTNSGLHQFRWNGTSFVSTLLTRTAGTCPGTGCFSQWEHVTFVPQQPSPPPPPAQSTTRTQGFWHNRNGLNVLTALKNSCGVTQVVIGGNGGSYTITFDGNYPSAINSFLPQGTAPAALTKSYLNPTKTDINDVFVGQVLTLQLNVLASDCGTTPFKVGLRNVSLTPFSPLAGVNTTGLTVGKVLDDANKALGGGALPSYVTSISQLNDLVDAINGLFDT